MKCRKNTENKIPRVAETKKENQAFACAVSESETSRFIKEEEECGWLSSLGTKTPLSKVPLVGSLLF